MPEYTYRATFSPEDGSYLAHCLELPGFWRRGNTAAEAIATIERAVTEEVASSASCGFTVPAPLTDRTYSGKFVVRMPQTLHAHLAVEAAEQGVSLNQWVLHKLTNRSLAPDF